MTEAVDHDSAVLRAVVRKHWHILGGEPENLDAALIACLLRVVASKDQQAAEELVARHGLDLDKIMAQVPSIDLAAAQNCAPVVIPVTHWIYALKRMRAFWSGRGAITARDVLAAGLGRLSEASKAVLQDPSRLARPKRQAPAPYKTAREVIAGPARCFAQAILIGDIYYMVRSTGTSDFLSGERHGEFSSAVSEIYRDMTAADARLQASALYWRSPLGEVHRELGEGPAKVLHIATAAELQLLRNEGPIPLKLLVFAFDPKRYLRWLQPVCRWINELAQAEYLDVSDDVLRPWQRVPVSDHWYADVLRWLHSADPISDEDAADARSRLL